MTNADVARVFAEVADLLEIKGADGFRINTYRRVARTVHDLSQDINDVYARNELDQLPGVGKASAKKIEELLTSGRLTLREELAAELPETLLQLIEVPNLGPKKIALLWRERQIASLADLAEAVERGGLDGLRGFGARTIEKIRAGIAFLRQTQGRIRLGVAAAIAARLEQALLEAPGVERITHAGSLRRGCETIGDLDLLCVAADPEAVVRQFVGLSGVGEVLASGTTKASVRFEYRPRRSLQVDLRIVPAASFGAAWQYFTGSKEHNVRLRERAVKRGWSLSEYGLTEGERLIAGATEEDIYAALELPWIPPELREDRGEFELREIPPELLRLEHIRGDLHMHTEASDGTNTIEELADAAKARGYAYICICDHSQSSTIANGLRPERLERQIERVHRLRKSLQGIEVWIGTEVDILSDGRLDYPDELLARLDFVVASVHSGLGGDAADNTRRTLAAIRNPYVNVIAHPTGRLINRRQPMAVDMDALAREAARTGTALEINASTFRLDLKDQHARLARERGATISINTDAHSTAELDQMQFGVTTARRALLCREHVLNAQPAADVRAFVQAKRHAFGVGD